MDFILRHAEQILMYCAITAEIDKRLEDSVTGFFIQNISHNLLLDVVAQVEFHPTCVPALETQDTSVPKAGLYPWPKSPARAGLRHGEKVFN